MQEHENHNLGPRSPASEQGGSTGRFQLSAKLTDKIQKLARWRIDPSSIEFPEETCEFKGGFATVSKALLVPPSDSEGGESTVPDSSRRKVVAVKKLKIESDKDLERVLGLALREARFLVEISHENIIELEGFVEDVSNRKIWLVFPWEDTGNLRGFVASQNWEIPERIWLIDDVARGVEYLHTQTPPICHGDLKSINILVNSDCRAVITDFGSARRLANDADLGTQMKQVETKAHLATSFEATFCTSTNTITLTGNEYTLRWAAPELLMDERPSLWSDMWAWGWVAYEVMTNTIPFQDVRKDSVVIKRVIEGDLPSITGDARMSLIQALCSLMILCWSVDPTKRPTAEECRKSMGWMPMIAPNPKRMADTAGSGARFPYLLLSLGDMHLKQRDYSNASKFFTEALETCTEIADSEGKASALQRLAELHRHRGMIDEAVPLYYEALQAYTDVGQSDGRGFTLCGLASLHRDRNEYSQAITNYSEALQISTDTEHVGLRANALYGLAEVHRAQGEYSQALGFYSEVLQIYTEIWDAWGRAKVLLGLAKLHLAREEYSQATTFYSDALRIFADLGDLEGRACALWDLASVRRAQNLYNEAIELYTQTAQVYEQLGRTELAAEVLGEAADVRRPLGFEEAA